MSNEKVIPTAWLIAYCRTFSDIPFSKEIFHEFEKICADKGQVVPDSMKNTRLAPQFEARYKLVRRLLGESGIRQVLEMASGLSPRGLETAVSDSSVAYVETDFSDLIQEKKRILDKIKKADLPNLSLEPANAFNLEELHGVIGHFNKHLSIAVINEGLMRYLSFQEKAVVANNVHNLLSEFGGIWVTPDISNRTSDSNEVLGNKLRDDIIKMTGINTNNNLFEDIPHAKSFFEDLGFVVESHSFIEVFDDLSSPRVLGLSDDEVRKQLNTRVVFVMKVK